MKRSEQKSLPRGITSDVKSATKTLWREFPAFKKVLASGGSIDHTRREVLKYLSKTTIKLNSCSPKLHRLEMHNAKECLGVLNNIFCSENEQLSGYSALSYLRRLAREDNKVCGEIKAGFVVEFIQLLRGATGKSGIYDNDKSLDFSKLKGLKAARARSKALDRMAADVHAYIKRYTGGLDPDVLERRRLRARQLASAMGASMKDWNNWRWQVGHVIHKAARLERFVKISKEEKKAIDLAVLNQIPFGITPHYLSLMDIEPSERDRAVRAQVIPNLEYVHKTIDSRRASPEELDFMRERDTAPEKLITRRYPMIAIIKPVDTCPQICVYCQRNWEICEVMAPRAIARREDLERAIKWIKETTVLREVLITGGDPALLSDRRLKALMSRLADFDHIQRIRIGTRTPVTIPQRIDDKFVNLLAQFHKPPRREVVIVTHFEHLYEISAESLDAVQRIRKKGISVLNQLVYTYYNSRRFETVSTRIALRLIGVEPYYTFNTQGKEETRHYRAPMARLQQENSEENRFVPGVVRHGKPVFNVPGIGKNYIHAHQNHEVLTIRPDGGRTLMFLPWEKNIQLADTFVYDDVPILDYLLRLADEGENLRDYRTIWYYF